MSDSRAEGITVIGENMRTIGMNLSRYLRFESGDPYKMVGTNEGADKDNPP